ncbi:MAG: hypothetical protein ACTSRS_22700 [Candidatus Helarchaeota archaeon]
MKIKKITEFVGYISGDGDCFCLSKVSYEEYNRIFDEVFLGKRDAEILKDLLMYPDDFFPEVDEDKKWKIKITVELEDA